MGIVFPDYSNSILSVVSSVLKSYGVACPHPGLSMLDGLLAKPHKNKILMIFDGLGSEYLTSLLPADSFLRTHQITNISSVYPCTTAAATTTMLSGLSPLEHGWLGWNAWFREFGRVIDLFLDRDSFSGTPVAPSAARLLLPYDDITRQIGRAWQGSVQCHKVMPPFDPNGVSSLTQMADRIRQFSQLDGSQLILAYWHEPDTLMHNEGPWSTAVQQELLACDQMLTELFAALEDTLVLITADHGQIEVNREIFLDEIPVLHDCLILPPFLETRAVSLFVKPAKKAVFAAAFQELLGDCFWLMPREEVFERGLFGPGIPHSKVDDFIGDYLACATGQTIIRYHSQFNRPRFAFKGHHAGLCGEEMIVPLICAEKC